MMLETRIVDDPTTARAMGWTKKHVLLEVYCVGKWRAMGYYTRKQLAMNKWQDKARAKLAANGVRAEVGFCLSSELRALCN